MVIVKRICDLFGNTKTQWVVALSKVPKQKMQIDWETEICCFVAGVFVALIVMLIGVPNEIWQGLVEMFGVVPL